MTPLLFTLAGMAMEAATFAIWGSPFFAVGLSRWEGVLTHAVACLFLYLAWIGEARTSPRDPKELFQVLITFFFPGFGLVLALLLRAQPSISPEEARALQASQEELALLPSLTQAVRTPSIQKAIQPIADILTGDDLELKREAIRRLAARKDPMSVDLLKKALLDPHGEIRLYAVNALHKMDEELVSAIRDAERRVAESSQELTPWMALGKAYLRYVDSGLLDAMLQRVYLQKGLRTFEKARSLYPEAPGTWLSALEIATRLGRQETVENLLGRALDRFPEDPGLRLFKAREAFSSGRYGEVRNALAGLPAARLTELQVPPEVLTLWQT